MRTYSKDYSKVYEAMKQKLDFSRDSRIYKPKLIDGKAIATFRLLEAPDSIVPFAAKKYHYWNKQEILCPKTFGLDCPICKFNLDYNLRNEKTYIRNLGTPQQSCYYINVAIISDKNVPENVGKNFIFKFGNPIKLKLDEVLNDKYIPWDEEFGINFKLEVVLKDNQNNYDSSRFVINDESDNIDNKYIETSLSKHFKDVESIKSGVFPITDLVKKSDLLSFNELKTLLDDRIAECDENGIPKFNKPNIRSEPKITTKPSKSIKDEPDSKFDDDDDFPMLK